MGITVRLRGRLHRALGRLRRQGRVAEAQICCGRWWAWKRAVDRRRVAERNALLAELRRRKARQALAADKAAVASMLSAQRQPAASSPVPTPRAPLTWDDAQREFQRLYLKDLAAEERAVNCRSRRLATAGRST
jgi:hypothetical protein